MSWQQIYQDRMDDFEDDRPLYYAVELGLPELVNLLLDRGADVSRPFNCGLTPLQVAASKGYVSIIRLLLLYHPDTDAKSWPCSLTALHIAAEAESPHSVKMLPDAGASSHARSNFGSRHSNVLHGVGQSRR
jgi:ankyrin repeat protein